ncbi:hypothetical protein CMI37_14140 [Candidatus Pacearchaeota archaeon]|nr:hypothetical protein [Candidatus Pacearchaeota archaeon]|tara:strand:- start:900 stop:1106 length:207 start_codon:yes stop_codon:yes gene_type:complete
MQTELPKNTPTCVGCERLEGEGFNEYCKAFPKGIPEDIQNGEFDHKKIHPLQTNEVVFEPNSLYKYLK